MKFKRQLRRTDIVGNSLLFKCVMMRLPEVCYRLTHCAYMNYLAKAARLRFLTPSVCTFRWTPHDQTAIFLSKVETLFSFFIVEVRLLHMRSLPIVLIYNDIIFST